MTIQTLSIKCSRCSGTGIDDNVNPSVSCAGCGGDGYVTSALVDTTELMEELGYIHGKVTAIWNKIKDN